MTAYDPRERKRRLRSDELASEAGALLDSLRSGGPVRERVEARKRAAAPRVVHDYPPPPPPREPPPPLPEPEMRAKLWEALACVYDHAADVGRVVIDVGGAEVGGEPAPRVVAVVDDLARVCSGAISLCDATRAALEAHAGSWADAYREHPATSRLVAHVRRAVIDTRREVAHALTSAGGR